MFLIVAFELIFMPDKLFQPGRVFEHFIMFACKYFFLHCVWVLFQIYFVSVYMDIAPCLQHHASEFDKCKTSDEVNADPMDEICKYAKCNFTV